MHTAALIDCLCVKLVCSCIHKLVSIETFLTGDVFSQLSLPITGGQEKMCLGRRLQGGGVHKCTSTNRQVLYLHWIFWCYVNE